MSFMIADALAAAEVPHQTDGSFSLVMIVLLFALFYFMMIRPQNKRAKQHKELISKLNKGDEVVTSSGILAKVAHVIDERYLKVTLASGVDVVLQREAVSVLLPKGTLDSL